MYATYDFYMNSYFGAMSEVDFLKYGSVASAEIDARTLDRAKDAPPNMAQRIATACCAVADALKEQAEINTRIGAGALKSANNDGYSETYATAAECDSTTSQRVADICAKWLSFPVNLLYRGR